MNRALAEAAITYARAARRLDRAKADRIEAFARKRKAESAFVNAEAERDAAEIAFNAATEAFRACAVELPETALHPTQPTLDERPARPVRRRNT